MASIQLGMRRFVAQLANPAFVCRQCLRQQKLPSRVSQLAAPRQPRSYATRSPTLSPSPLSVLSSQISTKAVRSSSTTTTAATAAADAASAVTAEASSTAQSSGASEASKNARPETASKAVAYWLLGSAASVFGIVVFGGLTRLTESGLSITEWRPVTGSLPPLSDADWEAEFAKYQASPEFALLNPHMTRDEFKSIYYMEWTHRLWGRIIGLTFVIPTAYLIARRRVPLRTGLHLAGISALIGFQGFIGWWMVKSGLRDDLFEPGSHPRVSQYRLVAHLATAFLCYSWMLLAGLSILRTRRLLAAPPAVAEAALAAAKSPALRPLRRAVAAVTGLVFLTAMSGALVAGLDAGLIYNEFPYMGNGLTPPCAELWDNFYSRRPDGADLWWRNILENPSLVQLDHRLLAISTFTSILLLFAYARRSKAVAAALPPAARRGLTGLVHLAFLQVALGLGTLLYMVPTHLAATHQAGSLALLTGALVLGHRLRAPPAAMRLLQKRVKMASTGLSNKV